MFPTDFEWFNTGQNYIKNPFAIDRFLHGICSRAYITVNVKSLDVYA